MRERRNHATIAWVHPTTLMGPLFFGGSLLHPVVSVLPMLWMLSFIVLLSGAVLTGVFPMVVAIAYLAMSLITFVAYASDKSAAESARWRTQESTLHMFGLVGGWSGAILAQQLLRHKSNKREFQTVFWMTVMLNSGALMWLALPDGDGVRALLRQMI